jgi:glycosyltransferase involved in cell wall biosynthesis
MNPPSRILISIIGHLAEAPRPQKEAAALVRAGHQVMIRGAWWSERLAAEDMELAKFIGADFAPLVDVRKGSKTALTSRIKRRVAVELYQKFGWVTPRSFGHSGPEILAEAKRLQPDLVIIHSEDGLWAGKRLIEHGFRVGVDFEDWFSEDLLPEARKGRPVEALAVLENYMLKHAVYCQATTQAMAEAMALSAEVERVPVAIPNVFPWIDRADMVQHEHDERGDEVSFYWVSQTIGPGRGLEVLGQALLKVRGNWQLRLRGTLRGKSDWFNDAFPASIRDRIKLLAPLPNVKLLARNASHDIGLALEIPYAPNKNLTASNKIFDYLRAGLAVVATDTAGQREVMAKCPNAGWLVTAGDVHALAQVLQEAVDTPSSLALRKQAALVAAEHRWSWEHYESTLVAMVNEALKK